MPVTFNPNASNSNGNTRPTKQNGSPKKVGRYHYSANELGARQNELWFSPNEEEAMASSYAKEQAEEAKSLTGFHIRNHLRNWGWGRTANAINNVVGTRRISPEELNELRQLRLQPSVSGASKTYGNAYDSSQLELRKFAMPKGVYEKRKYGVSADPTMRRIAVLSALNGANKAGGTRRKHNNRRKTRRN